MRKEFREAFRGYNQADVDLFLDQLTEEFARLYDENQRMRVRLGALQQELERLGEGGAESPRSVEELRRTEAEIRSRLRRFLEEQLALLEAAEKGVSATAHRIARDAPAPPPAPPEGPSAEPPREFWERE